MQGEGFWAGRPALFVRLVGCNLWSGYEDTRADDAARTGADCPLWCDTNFTKQDSTTYETPAAVVQAMRTLAPALDFCVLTGGEPLLQADGALIAALQDAGFTVAMETNGTVALADALEEGAWPDWITCSPKLPEGQLSLEHFDELKLVVPDYVPADYAAFAERARVHPVADEARPLLWLQPEDGPRLQDAQEQAVALALAHPAWRVSTQTHKVLNVA
ncbi:7-carboxy-7-deazaguanine synthase QueE [Salisaeta longa]|uniref:7-carboxy-7-deazaguanine synthase QueE n=1 Tax=Salisaeta longa TaxID=503170 RepID=UPI001E448A20|nr:7-carboxy-7-deazaguanine synthase QueE [Salisaeta longa]